MNRLVIGYIVLFIFFFPIATEVQIVKAHGIEKGPIIKSTEQYQIAFSTQPKYPVVGLETYLELEIKDKLNNSISDVDVNLEIHKAEKNITLITLSTNESVSGHYSAIYVFREKGDYEIHIEINGEEIETEFELRIDDFGLSGLLRSTIILVLIIILIVFAYRDCKKNCHDAKL